jgi:flagellar biosynthesis protein FlhF
MQLKSYYARDVRTALAVARQELGPEAMLVDSRKSPPEAQHLGDCEVVVAVGRPAAGGAAAPPPSYGAPANPEMAAELAALRRQMERMALRVSRTTLVASAHNVNPELTEAFADLLEAELDSDLAHGILNRMRAEGIPAGRERLRLAMAAELAGHFTCEPEIGVPGCPTRIVALVGPCGAGKTATLVKLAARFGLATRRPTQILSADTYRVAAAEQLRTYAAVLGVGFQVVDGARALAQALEEMRHKDLVLIDTPGYGPADLEAASEMADLLGSRQDVDVQLVLTASMRSADLSRVVARFERFRPRRLLFTRLDETEAFGPLINEAMRTGKPVSFLASGQRIPEDLEPATKERIIELVLSRTK